MVRVKINNVLGKLNQHLKAGKEQALIIHKNAEAFSHKDKMFVDLNTETSNALIAAVFYSFANHIPLEISPDVIFNTILQSIAAHVATNPEHFRHVFVSHSGVKQLETRDDTLVKGDWNNRWDTAITNIGVQILNDMSGQAAKQVLTTQFTTTTLTEYIAHTASFMNVVKHYYSYISITCCGIPYIDILGTKDDWLKMAAAISPLIQELGLTEWDKELQVILSHFATAFDGDIDWDHWNGIYMFHGPEESGSVAHVSGWIGKLFLYIKHGINPLLGSKTIEQLNIVPQRNIPRSEFANCPWKDESLWGSSVIKSNTRALKIHKVNKSPRIPLADFPVGFTQTEFKWKYLCTQYDMKLLSGIVGSTVTPSGALKPEVGWVIASDSQ